MVRWLDNSAVFLRAVRPAQEKGLLAQAYVLKNAVVKELTPSGYHTTLGNYGDFAVGTIRASVDVGPVYDSPEGLSVRVGTPEKVALYWELGHHNIFTRHFERDERWRPAYEGCREEMVTAYGRRFTREIRAAGFNVKGLGAVGG